MVAHWLKLDKKNESVLFGSSFRHKKKLKKFTDRFKSKKNVTVKLFCFPPILLEFLWNRLHVLPIEWLIGKVDVFFSSDWLQPPTSAKKVTTLHDLIVLKHPESFANIGGHDIVANQKLRLKWVKKEADMIVCDSLATKKDAMALLGIPEKRLKVIYLGI